VWRFRELLPFAPDSAIVTLARPNPLPARTTPSRTYCGAERGGAAPSIEGLNPSGSFKDNGMCAAFTHARMTGATKAACASTATPREPRDLRCRIRHAGHRFQSAAEDQLPQTVAALDTVRSPFRLKVTSTTRSDGCRKLSRQLGIYLVNSVNPFRLEGQKAIMFRVLEALAWEVPDWVVVPAGTLATCRPSRKHSANCAS